MSPGPLSDADWAGRLTNPLSDIWGRLSTPLSDIWGRLSLSNPLSDIWGRLSTPLSDIWGRLSNLCQTYGDVCQPLCQTYGDVCQTLCQTRQLVDALFAVREISSSRRRVPLYVWTDSPTWEKDGSLLSQFNSNCNTTSELISHSVL